MTVNLSFFNSTAFLFCTSDKQLKFRWEDLNTASKSKLLFRCVCCKEDTVFFWKIQVNLL